MLDGVSLVDRARRSRRPARPERLRQDDAARAARRHAARRRTASIALDGRPLADWPRRELARRIAVVPQETHATFDFSVLEIVLMGRYPHLGAFALEGPGRPRDRAAGARGHRHGGVRVAAVRTRSAAARSSASSSPARWRRRPSCCCSTSRRRRSTSGYQLESARAARAAEPRAAARRWCSRRTI